MNFKRLILGLMLILWFAQSVSAQKFEWLKSFGTKSLSDAIRGVVAEKNGNSIFLIGGGTNDTIGNDTLLLGSKSYPFKVGPYKNSTFIVKTDSNGNIFKSVDLGKFAGIDLCSDNNGSYFIEGSIVWNYYATINGIRYNSSAGSIVLMKLDSNFNFKWITQTGDSQSNIGNNLVPNSWTHPLNFSENKLLFTYSLYSGTTVVYGSIKPNNGTISWSKKLNLNPFTQINNGYDMSYISSIISKDNIIYMGFRNGASDFYLTGDTFFKYQTYIIKLDSNGNYFNRISFGVNIYLSNFNILLDKIFFTGAFSNSIQFGNNIFNTQLTPQHNFYECFIASISISLKPLWFYSPKIISPSIAFNGSFINQLIINDSFLYINCNSGHTFDINETKIGNGNFTAKFDLTGKVLWVASGGKKSYGSGYSMSALSEKSIFICGDYFDSLKYGNLKIKSKSKSLYSDGFILKFQDPTIARGYVKKGPYCAGDSIRVPYRKWYPFDTSNIFTAQLSNAYGNFDSGFYELGFVKSNKNGVILGKIPNSNMSSSANYRIRIVSTAPVVQSYYKIDTLRLLIYSRDKADAGKDTTICKGAAFEMKTFGGTHWEWSPNYFLSDSSKPVTKASPIVTTTYRIIISDSSGCGIRDTAYKTVFVRKPLSIESNINKDSSICHGQTIIIHTRFMFGDSLNYQWTWYTPKGTNGAYSKVKSGIGKLEDTLMYTQPLNSSLDKKFRIILKDNCSAPNDSANFIFKVRDTLGLGINTNDTTLCKGSSYTWRAKAFGGFNSGYQFVWRNKAGGAILSTTDSLKIIADSTMVVNLLFTDNCNSKSLSTFFTISVLQPLKSSILTMDYRSAKDSSICFGQSVQLFAKGSGGKGSGYTFNWKLHNVSLGSTDTLNLNTPAYFSKTGGTQNLVLTLGDNCTVPDDSAQIKLTVLPAIKTTLLFPDTACYRSKVAFKARGSGGKGTYTCRWTDANNVLQGNVDSLIIDYNNATQSGTIKRIVTVTDGCSPPDTNILTSEFLKPLSLSLLTADTCPTLSTVLNAFGSGGKNQNYIYHWWKENLYLGSTIVGAKTVTPNTTSVFKAVLQDGCSDVSDTVTIRIGLRPSLSLTVNGFCLGETTIGEVRNGQLTVGKGYNWQLDNVSLTGTDSIIKMMLPTTGKYKLKVSSDNSAQCIGRDTANFSIIEQPKADFTYQRLKDFSSGIPFQFGDLSANANVWFWQFGKSGTSNLQHPLYTFTDTGYIRVQQIASNQNICFDTMVKLVPVFDLIQFYFPNAFSPNGNNINDGFGLNPNQYYLVKKYHLEIYNRWGELLFKTDDVREQWNGSQQGVYLFKAVITDIFGEKREVTGAVEVLR